MKKWEMIIVCSTTYKNFLGKVKEEFEVLEPWICEAETEEEAIEKAKKIINGANTGRRFKRVCKITDWNSWTVKEAMEKLTGKEFAEWAKENGLTSLFN